MTLYKLRLDFAFSKVKDYMKLVIDDQEIKPANGIASYHSEITLPHKLFIKTSNKDNDGTLLDVNGNVLQDTCIRLVNVDINGVRPNADFIRRWPKVLVGGPGSNRIIYSHYWGFNGMIELDFRGDNLTKWLMRTNSYKDDSWNKWTNEYH